MGKKRLRILIFIAILILIIIGILTYFFITERNKDKKENTPVTNVVDIIKGYDYTLEDRDSQIFKEKFNELKVTLQTGNIDYEKYASLLSELYIIDLYTISNKENKYDVGGTEFVYPEAEENYELKVRDTIYKYVEDNSNKKRIQNLPEVISIEVLEINEDNFKVNDKEFEGYTVKLNWNYKEDLSYDDSAAVSLVKEENKLYIIEQSVGE